jgi:glycosyltransferase involved in cell wall biosynthesis
MPPAVSVIIPTYNRRALLGAAIESVLRQSWNDWELLVVDDGSTDGTAETIPNDPRIRFVAVAHSGNVAAVRNAGLDRATGACIGFLDSDDRWREGKLAAQFERLAACPGDGWCHGDYQLVDADGSARPRVGGWIAQEGMLLGSLLQGRAGISLVTVLVRRELALATRFDERIAFGEDRDFVLQLAARSSGCCVNAVVTEVLEHAGRTTHARYDHVLGAMAAYRKLSRSLGDPALARSARRCARHQLRTYLARARAAGQWRQGLARAWVKWWIR